MEAKSDTFRYEPRKAQHLAHISDCDSPDSIETTRCPTCKGQGKAFYKLGQCTTCEGTGSVMACFKHRVYWV